MNHYNSFNELVTGQDGGGRASDFNPAQGVMIKNEPPLHPIAEIEGYKFSMYANEGWKPHVHVKAPGNKKAEFWLTSPVSVKDSGNMRPDEQNAVIKLIEPNRETFVQQYKKYKDELGRQQQVQYDGKTIPKSNQESNRKQRKGRTYQQPDSVQPEG